MGTKEIFYIRKESNSHGILQILVNSTIFKLLINLSLMHLRARTACHELKEDLIHDRFENFEIYKCLYGKPC